MATCALEEGIDVPDCAFVVRFDEFATTKSHIQGAGRARHPAAVVFYFCNSPDLEAARAATMSRVARDPALGLAASERPSRYCTAFGCQCG